MADSLFSSAKSAIATVRHDSSSGSGGGGGSFGGGEGGSW